MGICETCGSILNKRKEIVKFCLNCDPELKEEKIPILSKLMIEFNDNYVPYGSIDPSIKKYIRWFNKHGFKTEGCCSGITKDHKDDERIITHGYISFKKLDDFRYNQLKRITKKINDQLTQPKDNSTPPWFKYRIDITEPNPDVTLCFNRFDLFQKLCYILNNNIKEELR